MLRGNTFTKMKKSLTKLSLIALALIVFTVACIKWPSKTHLLGDEYTCHIYSQDSFFQFYPLQNDDGYLLKRGIDDIYECMWDFIYNQEADAYEISTSDSNGDVIYLTLNDSNELEICNSCVDNSDRWNIVKVGNGLFYVILNANSDYALCFEEGGEADVGSVAPLDIDNYEFWMRLQ